MDSQGMANKVVLRATEAEATAAQQEQGPLRPGLRSWNLLNEALHVELIYADDLRAKELNRRH
jgi:hypothetical protein